LVADDVGLDEAARERGHEHEAVDAPIEEVPSPAVAEVRGRAEHGDGEIHAVMVGMQRRRRIG
jgi:hypothetical protein